MSGCEGNEYTRGKLKNGGDCEVEGRKRKPVEWLGMGSDNGLPHGCDVAPAFRLFYSLTWLLLPTTGTRIDGTFVFIVLFCS